MIRKLAHTLVILLAMAAMGFAPTNALAESVKDTGGYHAHYSKRDMQPIPDQDGHVLMLTVASGLATSPGGPLDGFSITEHQTADLRQGNGPQQGYVIFGKGFDPRGKDRLIVRFQGNVTTTLKDGQPNTTMKGRYAIVSASGVLAGMQGEGIYSGYFTAKNKYRIDWDGTRTVPKGAMVSAVKN
jgi:hypothetical protein